MAAIDSDAEQERHGLAYGQDERHRERGHAPRKPVDTDDAQQLRHRVHDEVCERRRQHERDRREGEGDGRTSGRPRELGRDAVPGKEKERQGEDVVVEHAFLPGGLVGRGLCCGGLDVPRVDVVLGEPEESGEEEGEGEDGDALGVEGDVG